MKLRWPRADIKHAVTQSQLYLCPHAGSKAITANQHRPPFTAHTAPDHTGVCVCVCVRDKLLNIIQSECDDSANCCYGNICKLFLHSQAAQSDEVKTKIRIIFFLCVCGV